MRIAGAWIGHTRYHFDTGSKCQGIEFGMRGSETRPGRASHHDDCMLGDGGQALNGKASLLGGFLDRFGSAVLGRFGVFGLLLFALFVVVARHLDAARRLNS